MIYLVNGFGDIPLDIINVNNGQGQKNKRYSNNCIDGKASTQSISMNNHNKNAHPSSNKNTNLLDTFTSTKNKAANVLDSFTKKIFFFRIYAETQYKFCWILFK